MVYEKLSNYCFCYGYTGHRCRKCAKCKSQPKEGLTYWVQLKAIPLVDRMKLHKRKESENREQRRSTKKNGKFGEYTDPPSTTTKPDQRK